MQAGRGVKDHVSRRQLHAVRAVSILDDQFTAVVLLRRAEKQRSGKVGANPMRRARHRPNRIVDMRAESLASLIAVEQGRKHFRRQGRGDEERVLPESIEDHLAQLPSGWGILGQLHIVLYASGLMTGGHTAINPVCLIE